MDPVGPWYASYNRLAAQAAAGEHHPLAAAAAAAAAASATTTAGSAASAPPTAAAVLPGSFLSPPPVGYETVFSPLFHNAVAASGAKPHYVAQVSFTVNSAIFFTHTHIENYLKVPNHHYQKGH